MCLHAFCNQIRHSDGKGNENLQKRAFAYISLLIVQRKARFIHDNDITEHQASRRNRSTRSHPFQYHLPNAYTDRLKFSFFSKTIATWNGFTTEAVSAETVDGFKSKI